MSKNSLDFEVGLLFGVAIGAVAGILFAPKAGSETRQELKDFSDNVYKNNKYVREYITLSADLINKLRYNIEEQTARISEAIKSGKLAAAKRKEELESGYNY